MSCLRTSAALAADGQQLGTVGGYGEVWRGAGFDATAYDRGKYDGPLTPGKFVDPVGFAVDTQDASLPDDTAIYVLDRISNLPADQHGYPSSASAVTRWRLQKLDDQGTAVATDEFTLPADANNDEMFGLAVDPSQNAVYALLVSDDQYGSDPLGVQETGVEYASEILGWSTVTPGPTIGPASGLPADAVSAGLGSDPTPGVLSTSAALDPGGAPQVQDPEGLALDQSAGADYLAVQSANDSGVSGANSGIAQVCVARCGAPGAITEQWSSAALRGLPDNTAGRGIAGDAPAGISTVPPGNGALSGSLIVELSNALSGSGDGTDNLDVADIPPSLPADGSGATILLSGAIYDDGDGLDAPVSTGAFWPRGGDPAGGEGTDYLPASQLVAMSNGLFAGELEPNTTDTTADWSQLNPGIRLLDPANAGGLLADANAPPGPDGAPLPPDTAILDTLGNSTVNATGTTAPASACSISDSTTASSKVSDNDGEAADTPGVGANPALAAGAGGAIWVLTRGTDSSPTAAEDDYGDPGGRTGDPTGGRELIELAPTASSASAAANPCPGPSGTFTMADGSGAPQSASTPLHVSPGDTVQFDGATIAYGDADVSAYEWSFGDGDSSVSTSDSGGGGSGAPASPQASETYETAGTYTVSLDQWGDYGEYVETGTVIVGSGGGGGTGPGGGGTGPGGGGTGPGGGGTGPGGGGSGSGAPTAAFTVSHASVPVGTPVDFDASGTQAPSGVSVADYNWTFGDNSFDTTTSPTESHVYAAPGTYTVALRAVGSDDDVSEPATETVVVTPAPATSTPGAPSSGGTTTTAPTSSAPGAPRLRLSFATTPSHGTVTVKLSCPSRQVSCAGTVEMQTLHALAVHGHSRRRRLLLGRSPFTVAGGRSTTVRIVLPAKATALLRRDRTLAVLATIEVHNPDAQGATSRYRLTLHAPRTPRPHRRHR